MPALSALDAKPVRRTSRRKIEAMDSGPPWRKQSLPREKNISMDPQCMREYTADSCAHGVL